MAGTGIAGAGDIGDTSDSPDGLIRLQIGARGLNLVPGDRQYRRPKYNHGAYTTSVFLGRV